ncbi:MAG: hypothetical protein FWG71_06520 [Synergistaceae bacterium]|nr:hypothetical protein [Synergistaceae bacterium]
MNLSCVWYVSGFKQTWEADVIGNLAEAMKSRGVSLRVYAKGGTARFRVGEVMSWNSLTFFERMKTVLFRGKLWHLWGDAPLWWGLVRLRARTVHTSLSKKPCWRGHPTRFFKEQASDGENRILPTFEPKAAWTDSWGSDEPDAALILAWDKDPDTRQDILESWTSVSDTDDEKFKHCKILVVDGSPTNALQAAFMTMRGIPVVARDAPLIREVLGPGGYIAAPQAGDRPGWEKALSDAALDAGRATSATARRFLKENYGARAAADSLESLYESVGKSRL